MYCQTISATHCKNSSDYRCLDIVSGNCRDNNKFCQIFTDGYCYDYTSITSACRKIIDNECVDHKSLKCININILEYNCRDPVTFDCINL